jgi:hypothetical protein
VIADPGVKFNGLLFSMAMAMSACGLFGPAVDCGDVPNDDCQQAVNAAQAFLGEDLVRAERISLQPFQLCAPDWGGSCPLLNVDVDFETTVAFHASGADPLLVNVVRERPGDRMSAFWPTGSN